MPTSQALVPNLVPPDNLINAVTLSAATQHASRLIGPLLIAPLVVTVGTSWAFTMCSLLYSLSLLLIMQIHIASTGVVDRERGVMRNLIAGVEFIYHHRLLKLVVLLTILHCSLTMAFESLIPVLSRQHWDTGEAGVCLHHDGGGSGSTGDRRLYCRRPDRKSSRKAVAVVWCRQRFRLPWLGTVRESTRRSRGGGDYGGCSCGLHDTGSGYYSVKSYLTESVDVSQASICSTSVA